jgi:peptide/nickel transport system substrate-binding protein
VRRPLGALSIVRTLQAVIRSSSGAVALLVAANWSAATLRVGLATEPDGLDPAFARVWSTTVVLNAICDKLIDITPDYRYVPQLATEWSWSDNDRVLVLKLRPGVKFHDGEPFNAAAVKYTIERNRAMRGCVWLPQYATIRGVEVIDDLTVRVTLSSPMTGPLFGRFVIAFGMIVSPKAAEAAGFVSIRRSAR